MPLEPIKPALGTLDDLRGHGARHAVAVQPSESAHAFGALDDDAELVGLGLRDLLIGVIVESSPNRTLSENQKSISMLRKRSILRHSCPEVKNQGFFVAQLGWPIRLKGNSFVRQPLAYDLGKIPR
jgi:hypothetical protein